MPTLRPLINEKSTLLSATNTHVFVCDDLNADLNKIQVCLALKKEGYDVESIRVIRQPAKIKVKGAKRNKKIVKRPKKFYVSFGKKADVNENTVIEL